MARDERRILRCAIYTRKSSEHGLEQDFNSLHAQREAAEAYIKSQAHEGWKLVRTNYDDGGLSGGSLERPALQSLLTAIRDRKIDVIVVYKVDRLTRSLADFAKLVELFEAHGVSFVSVTQQFNTTTSMGRLTLNVLLSFAQFEREISGERIRDKFAASRRKGMWMGGTVPLGYSVKDRKLIVDAAEADTVRLILQRYLVLGCVAKLRADLDQTGVRSKPRVLKSGRVLGGTSFGRGALYHLLRNRIYRGEVVHKGIVYPGEHQAIVDEELWDAVQAKLAGNTADRRQARIASGALLGGLVFDDRGNRMSPSYTQRTGGRYRYYVSQALLRGKKAEAGSRTRVGADDLEKLVIKTLRRQADPDGRAPDPSSAVWDPQTRDFVCTSIERVVIHDQEIEIILKPKDAGAIASISDDASDESRVPKALKAPLPGPRSRERKEILLASQAGYAPHRVDQALILALARGRCWMRALQRVEYSNTEEIARRFDLGDPHVHRLLRLAFLAPDIVESIIEGRQPRTLTVKMLLQSIPLSWAEQRNAFGFTNSSVLGRSQDLRG